MLDHKEYGAFSYDIVSSRCYSMLDSVGVSEPRWVERTSALRLAVERGWPRETTYDQIW